MSLRCSEISAILISGSESALLPTVIPVPSCTASVTSSSEHSLTSRRSFSSDAFFFCSVPDVFKPSLRRSFRVTDAFESSDRGCSVFRSFASAFRLSALVLFFSGAVLPLDVPDIDVFLTDPFAVSLIELLTELRIAEKSVCSLFLALYISPTLPAIPVTVLSLAICIRNPYHTANG